MSRAFIIDDKNYLCGKDGKEKEQQGLECKTAGCKSFKTR